MVSEDAARRSKRWGHGMAQKLGSSYTLEYVVGRGGMGEVWRGRDKSGRVYAVKIKKKKIIRVREMDLDRKK